MDRRSFFRRVKTSPFKSYIYPPYYDQKKDFLACMECEKKECLTACNENIIKIEDNIPVLDFTNSGCTFCDECALSCPKNVLSIIYKKNKLNCEMIINPNKCIAWNQTVCFSCQDICEKFAIIYKGMFNPVIDIDKCTSCGFCIKVCPADAIEIKII